jgi:hypothetical protein
MGFDSLRISAEANYRDEGLYAVSMWSLPGLDAADIAREVGTEELPHGQIRASTVGRLRAAGFEVVRSEPVPGRAPGHVDVILARPLTEEAADALRAEFDPGQPNPVARGRGGARG